MASGEVVALDEDNCGSKLLGTSVINLFAISIQFHIIITNIFLYQIVVSFLSANSIKLKIEHLQNICLLFKYP